MQPVHTPVRDAATILIVRDDPDLGVFMLRRNPALVFGGGAHVFPGGAVDPADRSPEAARSVVGLDDQAASRRLGLSEGGLGFWVAAVREAFEEGGILLTRDRSGSRADPRAFDDLRARLNSGDADSIDMFAHTDSQLVADDLSVLAHFVTPIGPPRRFDTWFFLAAAPDDQPGFHDRDETVDSEWFAPAELLDRANDGEIDLFGPTPQIVSLLSRFERASHVVEAVREAQWASNGAPAVARDGWGERVVLPGEPGFGRVSTSWTQPLVTPRLPVAYEVDDSEGAA